MCAGIGVGLCRFLRGFVLFLGVLALLLWYGVVGMFFVVVVVVCGGS